MPSGDASERGRGMEVGGEEEETEREGEEWGIARAREVETAWRGTTGSGYRVDLGVATDQLEEKDWAGLVGGCWAWLAGGCGAG